MKSKTSYFSKAVIKKDMTQFWPLWAVELFMAFMLFVMPLMNRIHQVLENDAKNLGAIPEDVAVYIRDLSNILSNPLLIAIFSIIVAIIIFGYTFNSREMYMIHSFPLKRECLFISHYVSCAVMMLIPYVMCFIGYAVIAKYYKTGMTMGVILLGFEVLAMIFLFLGIACAVVMICGNSVMAVVTYAVINILYIGISIMFSAINQMFSYASRDVSIADIAESRFIWLSPIVYIFKIAGFKEQRSATGEYQPGAAEKYIIPSSNLMPFIGVFAAGILIFVIALMLYKYRNSETVGDMVSFKWCKPVYRTVFSITGGVFLALVLWMVYFYESSFMLKHFGTGYQGGKLIYVSILVLLCVSICYFISEMILRKTFFVWKVFNKKNFAAIFAGMFILLVLEDTGIISVKIPDIENVSSLEISSCNALLYTDKEDISKFININKQIDREKADPGEDGNNCHIKFVYKLKDGTKRKFSYCIPNKKGSASDQLVSCANNSNQKYEAIFSRAYKDVDFKLQNVDVDIKSTDSSGSGVWQTQSVTSEESRKVIYDALKKDIAEGNIDMLDLDITIDSDANEYNIYFCPFVSQILSEKYKMTKSENAYFNVGVYNTYRESKSLCITSKAKNMSKAVSEIKKAGELSDVEVYDE